MVGDQSDVGLIIPAGVVVKMGEGLKSADLVLSVVEIPDELKNAAKTMRRGGSEELYGIMGPVILLAPTGTQFSPPITMTLPFNSSKVNRTLATQYLAIYRWHEEERRWLEMTGSTEIRDGVLATQTTSFSLYTVISTPMTPPTVPVVATPLFDVKDYAQVITSTELVMRESVVKRAKGPYRQTKLSIPKNTLITFPTAGETAIFVDFTEISLQQADALSRSKNRKIVSEWITNFRPFEVKFALAVNLTIMYNAQRVTTSGRRSSGSVRIAVHKWDERNRNWREIEGTFVPEEGSATCQTDSLGVYSVMSVPFEPVVLEEPAGTDKESPLLGIKLTTVIPAAIGGTCLIMLCAVVSFAFNRRSRGKKEVEKLKSALDRREDEKPDIDASVLQLDQQLAAKDEEETVSDKFQPADDVSALELSEQMAKRLGDSDDHVIDPSVLSLAQQLAKSESPQISKIGDQSDAASAYGMRTSALSDAGLSQVCFVLVSVLRVHCLSRAKQCLCCRTLFCALV